MKKNKDKKPFSDPRGMQVAGRPIPGTDHIPIEQKARRILRTPYQDSARLECLMIKYREGLKINPEAAMNIFWEQIAELRFTEQERQILRTAFGGDLTSIQILVKANAKVLELPFIIKRMIAVIRDYRYTRLRPRADIKKEWLNFLPIEEKNKNQMLYSDTFLQQQVKAEAKYDKHAPAARVAKALRIGKSTLRKKAPSKKGPGRFKKLS